MKSDQDDAIEEARRLLGELDKWFDEWSPGDLGQYPNCLELVADWIDAYDE